MARACHVTFVVSAFDRAAFVVRAVRSALEQTHRDLDVVVADFGSDDTAGVVREAFGGAVAVAKVPRGHVSEARNAALRSTHGKYVAFLNADCVAEPDRVARQLDLLETQPDAAVCYTAAGLCDEEGRSVGKEAPEPWIGGDHPSGSVFRRLLLGGNIVLTATTLVRREALGRLGTCPFDESGQISHDYDLWLRLSRHSSFVYLPTPLTRYRAATFGSPDADPARTTERHLAAFERSAVVAVQELGIPRREVDARRREILASLGYQHLVSGSRSEARSALGRAIASRPFSPRTAALWGATLLPAPALRGLRALKRRIAARRSGGDAG